MAYRNWGRHTWYPLRMSASTGLQSINFSINQSLHQPIPLILACRFRTAYLTEAAARQADTAAAEADEEVEWNNEIEADDVELDSESEDANHDADTAQRRAG